MRGRAAAAAPIPSCSRLRRTSFIVSPSVLSDGMRSVVLRHELRRRPAQPGLVHATGAGDVAEGKIERMEPHVLREALVPGCARLRGLDELFHDRLAGRLITGETI